MTKELQNFISDYIDIAEEELSEITALFKTKKIQKNSFLLRQGDT